MPTATPLNWVKSRSIGQVSEIAVLSPIKLGRVPGDAVSNRQRMVAERWAEHMVLAV